MRIAVYHDLPSGGAKRALRQQVAGLRARGNVVDAFLPATADESFLPLTPVADAVHRFAAPEPPSREAILSGSAGPAHYLRWLRFFAGLPRRERIIAASIDDGGYDVALVHPSQFTQAPLLLLALRTPAVYYCHEPLRGAYDPRIAPAHIRFAVRNTIGRLDRRGVRAARAIAANSRFNAASIRRVYGRDPRVVYLGVDTALFRASNLTPEDYVFTVGALHPLKGIDFLIAALGRVPESQRPRLVVASDRARDAERLRVQRAAAAAGVRLQLRIRVTEDELVALYDRARLVLYAPHDEPFGFVPLEAMACGRPVLAVAEGGMLETVRDGETGFLAPRDVTAFGARIGELLDPAGPAERVAAAAAQFVRREWSWQRSVEALEALCAETARSVAPVRGAGARASR